MAFIQIILIALGLSMDACAVAVSIGASRSDLSRVDAHRISFSFGLFQFLMPVVGWYLGSRIEPLIAQFDHWIAFGLLTLVGVRMIHSGIDKNETTKFKIPARGITLIMLSVATSIDALAVGLSLAMLRIQIFYPSLIIGAVTYLVTLIGMSLGNKLNSMVGKRMEIVGGIVLVLIGLLILLEYL